MNLAGVNVRPLDHALGAQVGKPGRHRGAVGRPIAHQLLLVARILIGHLRLAHGLAFGFELVATLPAGPVVIPATGGQEVEKECHRGRSNRQIHERTIGRAPQPVNPSSA